MELRPGEKPITREGILSIPEFIRTADSIEPTKTDGGRDAIRYTKRINGTTVFIEEVRNRRNKLALVSFYKKATGKTAGLQQTPEASLLPQQELHAGNSIDNIAQPVPEVNNDFIYEGDPLSVHQNRYDVAKSEVARLKKAAREETGGVGPAHQALQTAEKKAKGLGYKLYAAKKAAEKVTPAGTVGPSAQAENNQPSANVSNIIP